jgi:hypothetical protein
MRRTILPFALAPLALGAVPPSLTGTAEAQVVSGPANQQAEPAQAPVTSVLPTAPVPPQSQAERRQEAPVVPVPPPVLDRPVIGGPEITAEIGQSFELDTNLDLDEDSAGTSYFTETRLAFGLLEETDEQSITLGFDTGVRALWPAEDGFEWTFASPTTATAGYAREWASGAFETGFAYRQRRVDFSRDLLDFLDPDSGVIVVPDDPAELEGDATERRYDASFALGLATDAPSSYNFELSANRIDYDEDTTGELTPRTTLQGSATWTLAITPSFSGALSARGFYYKAENEAETQIRETELDGGIIYNASDVLQLTAGIGVLDRTQEEQAFNTTPAETEDEIGVSFRTGANYAFDDFIVNAGLRAASAPDLRFSGNLNVSYPFEGGVVNARAFQSYAGDTGGDEIRVLGGGIGLQRELDEVTNISFDLAATQRSNEDDPDDPDVRRIDFTTALEYEFTEQISADLGYRYRSVDDDPTEASSHAVFVAVGRTFSTGF